MCRNGVVEKLGAGMETHMKARIGILGVIVGVLAVAAAARAQDNRRSLTTTLLPVRETGAIQEQGANAGLLWIQNNPARDLYVQFDLRALPAGLGKGDFVRCTLRLVAQDVTYLPPKNPDTGGQLVIIKGQKANDALTPSADAREVVSLSTLADAAKKNSIALGAPQSLTDAVYDEYAGDKIITFRLHTDSNKASSLLYSSTKSGTASNIPRLVIEYKLPPPGLLESASWPQHQQNPEHSGRSPWVPFFTPSKFSLASIPLPRIDNKVVGVADYPLIYQGGIYVIGTVDNKNYLLSLDFKGAERWRRDIGGGIVQRSPVISRSGIMYVVTENQIAAYDLKQDGKSLVVSDNQKKDVPVLYTINSSAQEKLSAYTDVTLGNDGSLFLALARGDASYIYGFTPDLKPFLQAGPFATGAQKISTITVSSDGRKIFGQTPDGALVIDIANPSDQRRIALGSKQDKPFDYYHVPLAGPAGDLMIFSDFTGKAQAANIRGITAAKSVWSAAGKLSSQPVLGSNGVVYFIEDGKLKTHKYDQTGAVEVAGSGVGLNATSNLVMDGADNIYFWDNGYLHGYYPDGKPLFPKFAVTAGIIPERGKTIEGPEQFIRLTLAPDGTIWVNNRSGDTLFALKPSYAVTDPTLQQKDIKSQTVYRSEGKLTVGALAIDGNKQLILQAQKGIGFAAGFKVQTGSTIAARTGF
jgi:outer membrane protein assembly factor BamB